MSSVNPEQSRLTDPEGAAKLLGERYELPPESLRIYCRLWQLETWLRQMAYAHFRRPHNDDLARVEQFLRDVDQPFWRFVTSYNRNHPITPVTSDTVAQQFIEYDQYPWVEVEPKTWARLGRKERDAVLTLRVEYSIRPWVDKAKWGRRIAPNRGVLYDVEVQALDTRTLEFEPILERTRRLHARCVHIIIEGLPGLIRLTIPSVLPVEDVNETIQEFWEVTRRHISVIPRDLDEKNSADRIAANWPEYVLGAG